MPPSKQNLQIKSAKLRNWRILRYINGMIARFLFSKRIIFTSTRIDFRTFAIESNEPGSPIFLRVRENEKPDLDYRPAGNSPRTQLLDKL